ncbi:hypothetical protein KC865_01285 [Candidatus Kaiserbacteria bacterium]|nr:hypothetical protein [Candidatus Kaiserbacteria bacterium]MCA9364191.1 hypothetical protein [Candidatus Kaiserbacteria bacterium]
MPEDPQQATNQDPLNLFNSDSHIGFSLQGLQGQIDKQAQLSQNVIIGVLVAFIFVIVTVAIEIILFHSDSVSEEEYLHALEQQKENTELLIDNKLSEFKEKELIGARDTIEQESETN